MGSVLEGVENSSTVLVGDIEFTGSGEGNIVTQNAIYLLAEGLN